VRAAFIAALYAKKKTGRVASYNFLTSLFEVGSNGKRVRPSQIIDLRVKVNALGQKRTNVAEHRGILPVDEAITALNQRAQF
jgi:hypothetical protein